jgi:predicted nucleic acid-binding protein
MRMRQVVLDASVVLDWFSRPRDPATKRARRIRSEFETGSLEVLAPSLLPLEILNVTGRRWGWGPEPLERLAAALDDLLFDLVEPPLPAVARWVGAGLTAYDAAYVAVAEAAGAPLVTTDATILRIAIGVAKPP